MYKGIKNFLNTKLLIAWSIFFVGGHLVAQQPTGLAAIKERLLARKGLAPVAPLLPTKPAVVAAPIQPAVPALALPIKPSPAVQPNTGLGASRMSTVGNLALATERAKQARRDSLDEKSLQEVADSTASDRFTQTQAHLQMPRVRSAIDKNYRIEEYMNIVSAVLVQEEEHKDSHCVAYHTTENAWRVAQDLYKQLAAYNSSINNSPNKNLPEEYLPLRYGQYPSQSAKEFLMNELKENGLVDDQGKAAAYLLSVNFSLFGNVGYPSECTWDYFLRKKMNRIPDRETYETILTQFGFSHKYIDELLELPNAFKTPQKTILQIFVPKNKIDEIGYLSWASGVPAHPDIVDWARTHVKKKKWKKGEDKNALFSTQWLALHFKKAQEKNPQFKELIKSIEEGDYSLQSYLKIYCNSPWELPDINHVQGRLIVTPDILLNPNSGVEIYRYSTASRKQLNEYSRRLNEIVNKIINEGTNNG